jgi:hypothetical protein
VSAPLAAALWLLAGAPPPPASVAASLPTPAQARGGARSIGILILAAEDARLPISELYAAARGALEAETSLEVAPLDVFAESQADLRSCAGDGRCFAARIRDSGVELDLLLTLSAGRIKSTTLLGFRLIDLGTKTDLGATGAELGGSLGDVMRAELARIVPPGLWGQVGSLLVEVEPAGAEVQLGPRSCVAPCRIERLKPDRYEIAAKHPGFLLGRATAVVTAHQRASVRVDLEPEPEAWYTSPWIWAAAGGLVAGGTAAGVVLGRSRRPPDTFCLSANPAQRCP